MSDAFLVKSWIYVKLNLQCETKIFCTVLQIHTNTHSLGRVYDDQILYTHYELVWYKTVIKRERERESLNFIREEKTEFFLATLSKIQQ